MKTLEKQPAEAVKAILVSEGQAIAKNMFGYDPNIIANYLTGIAWVESRFEPNAHAPKPHTARGLFQVNKVTQTEAENKLGLPHASDDTVYNPNYNARLALYTFCSRLKKAKGNVRYAVAAYNQGNSSLAARIRATPYLAKWDNAMNRLQQLGLFGENSGVTISRAFY